MKTPLLVGGDRHGTHIEHNGVHDVKLVRPPRLTSPLPSKIAMREKIEYDVYTLRSIRTPDGKVEYLAAERLTDAQALRLVFEP